MEWAESLKRAIDYMETHLLDEMTAEDVSDNQHVSSFYFQKGFKIMTGYSVMEYIRCRRLYLAALEMIADRGKVIDLAYKYGYDTPESFTKAFSRFHGISPSQVKRKASQIRPFLPLKITVEIKGGYDMDYVIEQMDAMKMIGFEKAIPYEDSYRKIPQFWQEVYPMESDSGSRDEAQNRIRETMRACTVGEYGICLEGEKRSEYFSYLIAGIYNGCEVPEGMKVFEIPAAQWARFRCVGPLPGALQTINTKIFKEWLPGNPDYELAMGGNIEWYSNGDMKSPEYQSEIWIPVKSK